VEEEALLLRAVTRGIKTIAIGAIVRLQEMTQGEAGCERDFRRERVGIGTPLLVGEEIGTEVRLERIEIGVHQRRVDEQGTELRRGGDEMTEVFLEAGEIDLQIHVKAEI